MGGTNDVGVGVGDVIAGRYLVNRLLSQGGMGIVLVATHVDLLEQRAVKLMRPEVAADARLCERFLREARAAACLKNEHVAKVLDFGWHAGAPFIVMELLEGKNLDEMLKRRGPLPIEDAVLYTLQACAGLAEAHARGIVHRDVKPANLFHTRSPHGAPCIKLLDFGIVKIVDDWMAMTGSGLLGTPAYMSPEQFRGGADVDPRSDIWSLGVVLYELLTGRLPFEARNVILLLAKMVDGEPLPPSVRRLGVPAGLDAAVLRCLRKDPLARFPSLAQLAAALAPFAPAEAAQIPARVFATLEAGASLRPPPMPDSAAMETLGDLEETLPLGQARQSAPEAATRPEPAVSRPAG